MALIDPVIGIKLIYVFGITNAVFFLCIMFTCRCAIGFRFVNEMLKRPWYRWFFDHHCWYWRLFILSVIIHGLLAFLIFGDPLIG